MDLQSTLVCGIQWTGLQDAIGWMPSCHWTEADLFARNRGIRILSMEVNRQETIYLIFRWSPACHLLLDSLRAEPYLPR